MQKKVSLLIYGKVQKVGFRYWLRGKMMKIGVRGEARNNDDGTVSVKMSGEAEKIEQLIVCCRQGPALARVTKVDILKSDDDKLA